MFQELAKLFNSPLRIKLIKFFALQPDERCNARTVAPVVGSPRQKVQSELVSLVRIGILTSRTGRDGVQYGWNRAFHHSGAVENFLVATTMPDDKMIAELFRRLNVHLVATAGILVGESRGQVDLLIVTRRPKDVRIAATVKKLESLGALPIRYTVMEVGEYFDRTQAYDRLLRDIFDFKHRVILGRTSGK